MPMLKFKSRPLPSEAILQNAICEAYAGKQRGGQLIRFTECFLVSVSHDNLGLLKAINLNGLFGLWF